ncbi:unnamed protein product (macronuclear) [Paramecium tetraurelia]|uniref:Response regulatory domain-containing protein n=1 Tax=Paramecium tetraurelia TaxID=5888 RepID=A0BF24_PARTE|nr:uncharacterized protein GSPATT00028176001 [Paramecium tetraurelia]CAK57141.1 unnamed protein product [Paramecium tetraurelia]|eukprot:XP_001424539.1 hypothetical protein (macronuclear) [Paramecium tetraurelia strain d4-2]
MPPFSESFYVSLFQHIQVIILYKYKYQKKPKLLEISVMLYYCAYQLSLKGVPYIWFSLLSIAANKHIVQFIILLLIIVVTSAQIDPICPICHLQLLLEQIFLMGLLILNRFNFLTQKKKAQKQLLKQIFRKIRYCLYDENLMDVDTNKQSAPEISVLSGVSLYSNRLDNQQLQFKSQKDLKIKCYSISNGNEQESRIFGSKPLVFDSISGFLEIFQKEFKEMQNKIILASELDNPTGQKSKRRIYVQQFCNLGKKYNLIAMLQQDDNLMNKQNKNINKFKLSLSKIFTHKLKTPLNTTLGYLQTAISENLNVDEQLKSQFLKPAFINSKIQFYQVQDILEYINQEDLLQFRIVKVNLNKTLGLIYDLIELQCRAKQIKIEFLINEKPFNTREKPIYIQTDQQRLERILFNLLNKSYRHTQINGRICLHILIDSELNQVQFKINDNVLGFKQEQVDQINSFAQQQNKSISQFRNSIVKKSKFKFSLTLQITNKLIFFLSDMQCSLQVRNTIEEGASYYFFISMNCQQGSFQQTTDVQALNLSSQHKSTITLKQPLNSYPFLGYTRSQNQMSKERIYDGLDVDEEPCANKPFCLSTQNFSYSPQQTVLRTQQAQQSIIQYQKNIYQRDFNEKSLTMSLAFERSLNMKRIGDSVDIRQDFNQTIMLVDDEPFNHDTLKLMLKSLGFKNFISGYNGQQCIELVQKHHTSIKIIFMDLDMPIMGGIRATNILIELMQQNEIDYIPILACTAHDDKNTQEECLEAGMLCVIAKPVFVRSLQEAFVRVNEIKQRTLNVFAGSKVISSSIK